MKKLIEKVLSGSERTKVVKKNILGSFAVKGLSILTSFAIVPYTIKLLDQEKYGVWITIYSIVTWINMMDIGLGNGFRNKFAEAVAKNETELAKKYIQTLYSSMALILLGVITVYSIIHQFISWNSILNVKPNFNENLQLIVWCVFAMFCVQLLLKNISVILLALQKTAVSSLLIFIANLSSLIIIFFLREFQIANLFTISMSFMITPILVYSIVTPYLFLRSLKIYRPAFSIIPQKKYLNSLMGLGIKFFFIQITTVIMFSSDNLIITQLFGPEDVTPYNIVYRLFSSTTVFLMIIITPFWSAFTEANTKSDIKWIKDSIKKLIWIWAAFSIGVLTLWAISPYIVQLWVGKQVQVSYSLALQCALFTIILTWNSPFVYYISSVSKIKLELWIALGQCILTIPFAIFFAKNLDMGPAGVILATNIVLLIPAILIPIQYYKLVNGSATGIWNQ